MVNVLLTGFEPFDGSSLNPSAEAVRRLQKTGVEGCELQTLILPVDTARAPQMLAAALNQSPPDWCVMLGEARGRPKISVERVALNLLDFRIPDNAGHQIQDRPVVPGGPAAYFCTLPLREVCSAMQEADAPAELSLSAGTYLCNQVIYIALHTAASHGLKTRCGFLHLPSLPEQTAREQRSLPSMELDTVCRGIRAALQLLQADRAAQGTDAAPPRSAR